MKKQRCRHVNVWRFDAATNVVTVGCVRCGYPLAQFVSIDPSGDRLRALQSQENYQERAGCL